MGVIGISTKKKKKEKKDEPVPDPICDWHRICGKKAFAEVYPVDIISTIQTGELTFNEHGWSYLCFWHFVIATLRGDSLVWCEVDKTNATRFQDVVVNILDRVVKFYTLVRILLNFIKTFREVNKSYDDVANSNMISRLNGSKDRKR